MDSEEQPDVKVTRPDAPRDVVSQQGPFVPSMSVYAGQAFACNGDEHVFVGAPIYEGQHCVCGHMTYGEQREASAVELQMERCAALKGYAGKLRAAIQAVHATLFVAKEEVGITPLEESIYVTLSRALETPVPEDGT